MLLLLPAIALLAPWAAAAPQGAVTPSPTGPPVIYKTIATAPAVTATTLASVNGLSRRGPTNCKAKRNTAATCVPQPTGIDHKSTPDTASAFSVDPYYSSAASQAPVPSGYQAVFTDSHASPNAEDYLGFTLLDTYDVESCAQQCSNIDSCKSFNVYFSREPSVDPNDPSCSNPPSVTRIKCVWWGSVIDTPSNVNSGQFRGDFEVVIAGSNGYATGSAPSGFRIWVDGSNTFLDKRYLQVSPGEGAAVALNPSWGTTFDYGPNGELVQIDPDTNKAAAVPDNNGIWDLLTYRTLGETGTDYISCSGDQLISCQAKSGWQYAGVCPTREPSKRGLLYFGLPEDTPSDCTWIGLYKSSL